MTTQEKQEGNFTYVGVPFTQEIEITNAHYEHDRRVVVATVLAKISPSCFAYVHVYVGMDGNLRIDALHKDAKLDMDALLQMATYFALREQHIIELINKAHNGDVF